MSITSPPAIAFQGVAKRFPGVVALQGVTFDVARGELHAIVGENGAGKSTLMKCLSGVISDYEGQILLHGDGISFRSTSDAARAGVGIIHQELNLVEELSATANIFLGRERTNRLGLLDDRAMYREACQLLAQLDCKIDPSTIVRELRVGDQQLIEIAKALAVNSEVLVMDEPTSALTETEGARLFRVIARLRQQGVTILYISHKMDEVFALADKITVLRDGVLVCTLDRDKTTPREVTHRMVGREIEQTDLTTSRTAGDVVLEVNNLSLPWPNHPRQWRLHEVSFCLRKGEILGLAGLMGAGRTELLECLFGAAGRRPQGRIRIDGQEVVLRNPGHAMRQGIALVTEDRKRLGIFPNLDVGKNITIASLRQAGRFGTIGLRADRMLAGRSAGQLGVKTAGMAAAIGSLSGGNQQKAILSRWLLRNPKVLLLDDPTRGVDVGAKAELYRIMDHLCRSGLGIIVTSSELPELLALCDRILVLCEGRITGELQRGEATEQRIMELAVKQ